MRRLFPAICLAALLPAAASANWPQWRGPSLNGVSEEKNLPVKWSATENVVWKLPVPDRSGSTPIVWGERVFLNIAEGDELALWCVDRAKGSVVWKRKLGGGNMMMRKHNMASPSPVTDGKSVWVMTGTGVLKGFDFGGRELWARDIQKDYGAFGLKWGYASSPLLYEDSLYVQVLHGMTTDDPSYVLRVDKKTGKTLWRVERPTDAVSESPDAYTTPTLLRVGKATEIVVSGGDYVTGHDPATGKELWRAGGLNPERNPNNNVVSSPIVSDGLVYVPGKVKPLLTFRAGGRGDVSKSHLVWSIENGPYVPTPVTDGKLFYVVNDRGIVWCFDAKTGKEVYGRQRLKPGSYSGSPVLADGKVYVTNEDGLTSVFKAGPQFELLAENNLGEYCLSSPAVSAGQIFIRTSDHLYCIGSQKR
ncbi:MAG TPA: PQQ-binding-like beta-propeller repeat protein [Pyrinomonadaceae bacterium]|jgi:outer membrane protein assembly factor BamB|nr:PQQ-binding-like beta-propeller repeat protein [Pyrinomonadaceae bacterium]